MVEELLSKLRRDEALVKLPTGDEGVRITLQFLGKVPPLPRAERHAWLQDRFAALADQLAHDGIVLQQGEVSTSAQAIESVVRVDDLTKLTSEVERGEYRVDIARKLKAAF